MESSYGGRPRKARVLVVDDDESFLELAGTMLEESGHEVVACRSREEALRRFRSPGGTAPDLILADAGLAGRGGGGLHQMLLQDESTRDIPMIIVAGEDHPAFSQFANAAEFLVKPFGMFELYQAFENALEAHA